MSAEKTTKSEEAATMVEAEKIKEETGNKPLNGLVVQDGVILIQLVDRLFARGAVAGQEAMVVGAIRGKLAQSLAQQGVTEGQG